LESSSNTTRIKSTPRITAMVAWVQGKGQARGRRRRGDGDDGRGRKGTGGAELQLQILLTAIDQLVQADSCAGQNGVLAALSSALVLISHCRRNQNHNTHAHTNTHIQQARIGRLRGVGKQGFMGGQRVREREREPRALLTRDFQGLAVGNVGNQHLARSVR
jgi:hypothetical protein